MQETQETQVRSECREDPLEEEMANRSCSCLENLMDRGAWRAPVHGVAKSWTRLNTLTHTHTTEPCLWIHTILPPAHQHYISIFFLISETKLYTIKHEIRCTYHKI